jgi:hypothetical protein
MAVHAFFLLRVGLHPHMQTGLLSAEVAAKEAAVTVPLKRCAAILTGNAVVVAYSFEVLTLVSKRRDYHRTVCALPAITSSPTKS